MDEELKTEHYLLQLDRHLKDLPVSQRAEIITDIKTQIRQAVAREPQGLDAVLREMGPAKEVAQRYLTAKGVTTTVRHERMGSGGSGGTWFKWLAIGTVVFFAGVFVAGMGVIYYFSPLIKIDRKGGRVTLFGGRIDVNEQLGQVKVGNLTVKEALDDQYSINVHGARELTPAHVKLLRIPFNTAKLDLQSGTTTRLSWSCDTTHNSSKPQVVIVGGVATLNLDTLNLARCMISLPLGLATEIRGVNGHMDVDKPTAALDIQMSNGKVNVMADPAQTYDFDVNVKNGLQDIFPRSADPEAVKVKINVTNGMVKKE